MRVGVYARTESGIVRDVLYSLKGDEAVPDTPDSQTHKNLVRMGVRLGADRYYPKDGKKFLKVLAETMQGSYMWAKKEE